MPKALSCCLKMIFYAIIFVFVIAIVIFANKSWQSGKSMNKTINKFLYSIAQEQFQEALLNTTESFQESVNIKELISLSEKYSLDKTTKFNSSNIHINIGKGGLFRGIVATQKRNSPVTFNILIEDEQFKIHSIFLEPSGIFTGDVELSFPNTQQQTQLIQDTLKAFCNSLIKQDPKIIHNFMGKQLQDIFTPQEIFSKIIGFTPMAHDILKFAEQPCLSKPIHIDENGLLNINLNIVVKNPIEEDAQATLIKIDLQYIYYFFEWKLIRFNIRS